MSAIRVPFFALVCLFVFLRGQSSANVLNRIPAKIETAVALSLNLPFLASTTHSRLVDTVFIIDDSGSIPPNHFKYLLNGLKIFFDNSARDSKIAAIKYSSISTILFNFVSKDQAKRQLDNVRQDKGMTNTQAALKMAREDLFLNPASSGHRRGAVRVAVLVTDGASNVQKDQTVRQATLLKGHGTKVFVIAIGKYDFSELREMKDIASYPSEKHFFQVRDFENFQDVARMVQARVQQG